MVTGAVYHYCTDDLTKSQRISVPIIYFAISTIWIYCIMCVWSYYSELSERMPYSRDIEDEEEGIPFVQLSLKPQKIHPHSIWEDESSLSSEVERKQQQQYSSNKNREGRTNSRTVKSESSIKIHHEKGQEKLNEVDSLLDYGGVDLDPA